MTKFNLPFPYIVDHIPKDIPIPNNNNKPFQKRPQFKLDWEFITIHDTGNEKSTAKNERGWLTNPINISSTGWHIVVDEKEAIETIPLNEVAWACGDGANGTGNRKSISIELCESGNRQKTLSNAVLLVVALLKSKNKNIESIKQHYDWSKRICPRLLRANNNAGWEKFINLVQQEINKQKAGDLVSKYFTDVINDKEAIEAIDTLYEKGIINGIGNNKFNPEGTITRKQCALMMKRLLDYMESKGGKLGE